MPTGIRIIKSRRRSMVMSMDREGIVTIKVPTFTPKFAIDQFIRANEEWIEKQKARLAKHHSFVNRKYIDGELFLYLGKEFRLKIGDYTTITPHGENLLFPKFLEFRIEKELRGWYIKQAEGLITERVNWYAKDLGTSYNGKITFSDTSSKWGSCTHDNRLQFCWRLIMAPILVINYVVVHELVHTIEKNHSHDFWKHVRVYNPSYRQQIKWLKENGDRLTL